MSIKEDPEELICDELATAINAMSTLSMTCFASTPEDPFGELDLAHQTVQVMFVPYAEEEDKIGRGGQAVEKFTVSMMVVRQIDATFTRKRLAKFVRQLKDEIRGVRMANYVYVNMETMTKFDMERLHEQQQFVSVTRINYTGTGHHNAKNEAA